MFEILKQLFNLSTEKRLSESDLSDVLNGALKSSKVTKEEALNIPAVSTSVDFIAGTIAGLPIKLYKRKDNNIEEIEDDYRLKLLNKETGDLLDSYQFRKAIITDMLLDGEGYAYIEHERNKISGLYYVDSRYVSVLNSVDPIKKNMRIYLNGTEYPLYEIFRLTKNTKDGVTGSGIIDTNPVLLNAMYNALKYENNGISTGTKRGFIKSKYKLDKSMMESLKDAWHKLYSTDVNEKSDVMVLNEGLDFEPASSTATENQLNESKQTNTSLVYQLFGLSETLFDSSKGNRDAYINNIKTGVIPVINAFNNALNKFLLLEKEKGTLFFAIDVSEILKSSIADRYNAYNIAIEGGWMQIDEVRKKENLPPLGMDFVKMSLGNIMYYPETGQIYTPNTNQITSISSESSQNEPHGAESISEGVSLSDTQNTLQNANQKAEGVIKSEN